MPALRRTLATFVDVEPYEAAPDGSFGVDLGFRPERSRLEVDRLEHRAALGPEHCLPAVAGLGSVLRLLRAARLRAPEALELLEDGARASSLLGRAIGTRVALSLRPRVRIDWRAWTEEGIRTVEGIAEVLDTPEAYLVLLPGQRAPLRFPRNRVTRQQTLREHWYEVQAIERP